MAEPQNLEVLTDESPMPKMAKYTKFIGTKMEDVPSWYLIWLEKLDGVPQNVLDYIEENRDVLNQEQKENKH